MASYDDRAWGDRRAYVLLENRRLLMVMREISNHEPGIATSNPLPEVAGQDLNIHPWG